MENELNFLENRITVLIARLNELHTQNKRLNESLTQTLREKAELQERLERAASSVESLIERLPKAEEAQS